VPPVEKKGVTRDDGVATEGVPLAEKEGVTRDDGMGTEGVPPV
jgi:hypothetical protein